MRASSTILTVDRGNTFTKVMAFRGTEVVERSTFSNSDSLDGFGRLGSLNPQGAIVTFSGRRDGKLLTAFKEICGGGKVMELNHDMRLPVDISVYHNRALGLDRLAALAGAAVSMPETPVLIIDLGTAVTYDFLTADRVYRGGNIAPGMSMRFKSLHDFTANLPEVSPEGEVSLWGFDTETAIRNGVVQGMVFEIAQYLGVVAEKSGSFKTLLTGGDAPYFMKVLKEDNFLPIKLHENRNLVFMPDLVGRGLLEIYNLNENN